MNYWDLPALEFYGFADNVYDYLLYLGLCDKYPCEGYLVYPVLQLV